MRQANSLKFFKMLKLTVLLIENNIYISRYRFKKLIPDFCTPHKEFEYNNSVIHYKGVAVCLGF